jgi:GTP cyclohydrolase I
MIKEMKSYEKIEQYDTEITEALADNYKVIIENRRRRKPRRLTENS